MVKINKVESIEKTYTKESHVSTQFITVGDSIELKIPDFQKPIGKKKYLKTTYLMYNCFVASRNGETINDNKIVQFPSRVVWCKLYEHLAARDMLNTKDIIVKIIKKTTYSYEISIHSI